jgi:hypothetical protein
VIRIDMLPAAQGDSLWIEYGQAAHPYRVLIDGGTAATYDWLRTRIRSLPSNQRRFELLVVTHVDADHIEGAVRLLNDPALDLEFGDIWFNGWDQLSDMLGPLQGEFLSALIKTGELPWNRAFRGGAVMVPEHGALPVCELDGGLKLTLLSPRRSELVRLRDVWLDVVTEAGMAPGVTRQALLILEQAKKLRPAPSDLLGGDEAESLQQLADEPSRRDRKEANASSIVVLAEYENDGQAKSCLFAADAVPDVLEETLPQLLRERNLQKLALDAFKLPHHGSQSNVTAKLVRMVPADKYLFSTSGAYFNHPDKQAVSRVILDGGRKSSLIFNYRTQDNEVWDGK